MLAKQKTLKEEVWFEGVGVHSGKRGVLRLRPAEANSGVVLQNAQDLSKIIHVGKVIPLSAKHATILNNGNGWTVSTIEHVMAAVGVLGVDNIIIEVEGAEFPIMDGSSLPFVKKILEVGLIEQDMPKQYLTPKETITFHDNEHNRDLIIYPAEMNCSGLDKNLYLEYNADFDHPHVPASSMKCCLSEDLFVNEIAPARTFGFLEQLPFLQKLGLAKGASLDNTIVISDNGIINEIRFEDECMRHKLLDLLGDLTLLGRKLIGTVKAKRTGHNFNRLVVEHYINHPEKWAIV